MAMRAPYSFASGVFLKSTMPATRAEVVFITNDKEGQLLSDSMGARQQQIPKPSKRGVLPNRTAFESRA